MPTDKLFTGHQRESTDEVYHYGARMYDADIGRMPQADTIVPHATDPQAYNRYTYVYNNPVNFVDPTGHAPIACQDFLGYTKFTSTAVMIWGWSRCSARVTQIFLRLTLQRFTPPYPWADIRVYTKTCWPLRVECLLQSPLITDRAAGTYRVKLRSTTTLPPGYRWFQPIQCAYQVTCPVTSYSSTFKLP